ncbi:MAG: phosphate ABC transporter permease subunit PstC [Nitrososphaerales archaeon]
MINIFYNAKPSIEVKSRKKFFNFDGIFKWITAGASAYLLLVIALMVIEITIGAEPALSRFGFDFLIGSEWNPVQGREVYGVLPYILGTLVTSAIAIVLGVPVSIGIAMYLVEMAHKHVRTTLSFLVELLAAVPSVIYGLWGLFVLRFWLKDYIEAPLATHLGFIPIFSSSGTPLGLNVLTAGVILAIMIIPTVSAVSREVFMAVPNAQREAAYAIGATKWEVFRRAVIPYAKSGIFGATILGLGRAVGETMAVTMVIGNVVGEKALPFSLLEPGQTMASIIANEFNEADPFSLHPAALIGVGLVLFTVAMAINVIATLMISRMVKTKGSVE